MASVWRSDEFDDVPWPIRGPRKARGYERWEWDCNWCGISITRTGFHHQAEQDSTDHVFDCPEKPAGFRSKPEA